MFFPVSKRSFLEKKRRFSKTFEWQRLHPEYRRSGTRSVANNAVLPRRHCLKAQQHGGSGILDFLDLPKWSVPWTTKRTHKGRGEKVAPLRKTRWKCSIAPKREERRRRAPNKVKLHRDPSWPLWAPPAVTEMASEKAPHLAPPFDIPKTKGTRQRSKNNSVNTSEIGQRLLQSRVVMYMLGGQERKKSKIKNRDRRRHPNERSLKSMDILLIATPVGEHNSWKKLMRAEHHTRVRRLSHLQQASCFRDHQSKKCRIFPEWQVCLLGETCNVTSRLRIRLPETTLDIVEFGATASPSTPTWSCKGSDRIWSCLTWPYPLPRRPMSYLLQGSEQLIFEGKHPSFNITAAILQLLVLDISSHTFLYDTTKTIIARCSLLLGGTT